EGERAEADHRPAFTRPRQSRQSENRCELVRRRSERAAVRADFGGHQPLGTRPEADEYGLTRPQLGKAVAPKRFHVDENIGGAPTAGQKTETAEPVEPFDLRALESAGRGDGNMRARRRHL